MSIERMHSDAIGVQGPNPASGRVWLNTVPVVDRLVRDFTKQVIERADDTQDYFSWLDFECRRMNGLFMGTSQTQKFDRGPWNAEDQIGNYVARTMQINGEARFVVRDAFMIHAAHTLQIMQVSDGKADGEWQEKLELAIANIRSALLGVPVTI